METVVISSGGIKNIYKKENLTLNSLYDSHALGNLVASVAHSTD